MVLGALAVLGAGCAAPRYRSAVPVREVRAVSYNIRHGRGADGRVDLERTAAVLRALRPDVVGLQEVDSMVDRSGRVAQAESLAALLGMHHTFGGFMAYQGGRYGMAILSRFPILAAESMRLPDGHEPRIALTAVVTLPDGLPVAVVNVHFDWVDDDAFRFAQASALVQRLDQLDRPMIVLGDFNDQPGSRTLALLQGRLDEAAKPPDARFTWSATRPDREIDFLFGGPRGYWAVEPARVVPDTLASDHRPVVALFRSGSNR